MQTYINTYIAINIQTSTSTDNKECLKLAACISIFTLLVVHNLAEMATTTTDTEQLLKA